VHKVPQPQQVSQFYSQKTHTRAHGPPIRCGANNIAVTQLLQCTADMVVSLAEGGLSPGMCALTYTPVLAAGTLRVLPGFPCSVFSYTGIGADAVSASAQDDRRAVAWGGQCCTGIPFALTEWRLIEWCPWQQLVKPAGCNTAPALR
jgi:hypothetical protein